MALSKRPTGARRRAQRVACTEDHETPEAPARTRVYTPSGSGRLVFAATRPEGHESKALSLSRGHSEECERSEEVWEWKRHRWAPGSTSSVCAPANSMLARQRTSSVGGANTLRGMVAAPRNSTRRPPSSARRGSRPSPKPASARPRSSAGRGPNAKPRWLGTPPS